MMDSVFWDVQSGMAMVAGHDAFWEVNYLTRILADIDRYDVT